MATITYFMAQNHLGQKLRDDHVRPLCQRLGVNLIVAPSGANRGYTLAAQTRSDLLLWDCSVESGHIYHALTEWHKTSNAQLLVSRTPLPRNVLAKNQCAPMHGEMFTNDDIGEWLSVHLPELLGKGERTRQSRIYTSKVLQRHCWMSPSSADVFLSSRGSQQKHAEKWKRRFEEDLGMSVRMVPKGGYAYETECLPRQHMWEVMARLQYEMRACKQRIVFWSDDYCDSFWTVSELLCILYIYARARDGSVQGAYLVPDKHSTQVAPLHVGVPAFPVPELTKAQGKWLRKILNNSDPMTVAHETRVPPTGLGRLTAFLLKPIFGYYDPRFTNKSFWRDIRVPCPHCKPKKRPPDTVDWDRHLDLSDQEEVDFFGYFAVPPEQLSQGIIRCPLCKNEVIVTCERQPRTVWVPMLTTERDSTRPVIEEIPVWEVVAGKE